MENINRTFTMHNYIDYVSNDNALDFITKLAAYLKESGSDLRVGLIDGVINLGVDDLFNWAISDMPGVDEGLNCIVSDTAEQDEKNKKVNIVIGKNEVGNVTIDCSDGSF